MRASKGKIFVFYDDFGVIRATAASAHPNTSVVARSRHQVHEVDHPGTNGDELMRHLAELHSEHKMDLSDEPRIVRK